MTGKEAYITIKNFCEKMKGSPDPNKKLQKNCMMAQVAQPKAKKAVQSAIAKPLTAYGEMAQQIVDIIRGAGPNKISSQALAQLTGRSKMAMGLWLSRNHSKYGITVEGSWNSGLCSIKSESKPREIITPGIAQDTREERQPKKRGPKKGRVHWSEEETQLLVMQAIETWKNNPTHNPTLREYFIKNMHRILTPDRWRTINTIPKDILARLEEAMREELKGREPEVKEVFLPQPVCEVLKKASFGELFGELGNRLDSFLELFARDVSARHYGGTNGKPCEQSPSPTNGTRANYPDYPNYPRNQEQPNQLRVWMTGPLNGQYEDMINRLKGLPVRFMGLGDKSKSPSNINVPQSADYYLVDSNFIGHGYLNALKSYVPREKIVQLPGLRSIENFIRSKAGMAVAK